MWKTQEKSTSQVEYWVANGEHQFTELLDEEDRVITHTITLTGLIPATTYYFIAQSRDASYNLGLSEEMTFTTRGEPAEFVIMGLTVTPGEVDIGGEITITLTVTNTGDAKAAYVATLLLNGEAVDAQTIALTGRSEQEIVFTVRPEEGGTYEVDVNGLTDSFEVIIPSTPTPQPTPTPIPTFTPQPEPDTEINWIFVGILIAGGTAVLTVVISFLVFRRRP
jgi:hypothetical protein